MATLADLKSEKDYERLDQLDPATVKLRWWIRHTPGDQIIVSWLGRTCFAQSFPGNVILQSPYEANQCAGWFTVVEMTDEQAAEEERWHDEIESWRFQMFLGDDAEREFAANRTNRLRDENAHRTRNLRRNRTIGRVRDFY